MMDASPKLASATGVETPWAIRLFQRSVLKQNKYKQLVSFLGKTEGLDCLDLGGDNGVISYLLRQRGGNWKSADLDEQSVDAIKQLVGEGVYQTDERLAPFSNEEFDRVVIVDFLEHVEDDERLADELFRVLKPGGALIVNTPHLKNSLLRRFRLAIGQTDEKHGHVRPGYTVESMEALLGEGFALQVYKTYSGFFTELIDTIIVQAVYFLQRNKSEASQKGAIVTGSDLQKHRKMFRFYSLIYPVVWLASKLDLLLFWSSGYMLIVKATVKKEGRSI